MLGAWILQHIWGWPTTIMFGSARGASTAGVWNRVKVIGRAIATFLIWLAQPGYRRPYSAGFSAPFAKAFAKVFPTMGKANNEHDRFWPCWEYVSLAHPAGYRPATHFLELYGFSRSVSMAFLLSAFLPLFPGWSAPIAGPSWAGTAALVGAVFFLNYRKLIRRMNDEVYRAFVVAAGFRGKMLGSE